LFVGTILPLWGVKYIKKGRSVIKKISKLEGKIMIEICPQYISRTIKKRHYYMVECEQAYKILNKIRDLIPHNKCSEIIKILKNKKS